MNDEVTEILKKIHVECTDFPSLTKYKIGFKTASKKPVEPYFYDGASFLHINGEEDFNALLGQINGLTYVQFKMKYSIPKKVSVTNDYIMYIDQRIQKALVTTGICITVSTNNSKENVCFYTEPGRYVVNVTKGKGYFLRE